MLTSSLAALPQAIHGDIPAFLRSQGAIGQGMYDQLLAHGHQKAALDAVIKAQGIQVGGKLAASNPDLVAKPSEPKKDRNALPTNMLQGLGSKGVSRLNKEYGEGNWNLTGGKGFYASGTTDVYNRQEGGMVKKTVYTKAPKPQKPPAPQQQAAPAVQQDTSQIDALQPLDVGQQAEPQGPTMEDIAGMFAGQIAEMQAGLTQSMNQQAQMFAEMQAAQNERMENLTMQMMNAQIASQARPQIMGVKGANSSAGDAMTIARRGVTGAFGRGGMRIQNLNV